MAQRTDLRASGAQDHTEYQTKAAEVLAMVAGHLATVDPKDPVDELAVTVLVGAKVYEAGGRSGRSGGVRVSRLALRALGDVGGGVSREAFAVQAAEAAQRLGYDWTADDNRRVIPKIPAPRREPEPEAGR
ncbi:hypothetical protein [Streptomyces sp. AMCC400023]|uniref:hypothetical protein n=1 Tax=Streptomyces sp. AMCC400023 TaxID=2056258 RepID=UPI001F4172EA|nr:hypothetical protein [Streptomyces sp. AMCC400023]UJV42946.1 hypothetical protein CVT30_26665 [Streptomyces sp. AMCC400023]